MRDSEVAFADGSVASGERCDCLVMIVDDCWRIREALPEQLASAGFKSVAFESLTDYSNFQRPDLASCLILDVQLPDANGLDYQAGLANQSHPPIIFITGDGDIPSSVRAIKHGAVDYLTKPFAPEQLMRAVEAALALDSKARLERAQLEALQARFALLTPREREVYPLVVAGLLNKQAAAELGIREVTLQIHRRKVMQKMQARSLADLVRMAVALDLNGARRFG